MASEQIKRENVTTTDEQLGMDVEKDKVPNIASYFESLTMETQDESQEHKKSPRQFDPLTDGGGGSDMPSNQKKESSTKVENATPSLEETTNLRQQAQQNSIDSIRIAEDKYEQAKEMALAAFDSAEGTTAGAIKPVQQGAESASQIASEKAKALKDATVPAAMQAKDYTYDKAVQAKDVVASAGGKTAGFVQEKAVAAKDVTVDSGKTAVGYAGKMASDATDYTAAAGWGAASYTAEKAAQATKVVTGAAANAAGYAGETVVVAKDKVAGAGQTVIDYTSDKLAAARDAVVSTEESAAEFAARKQEEAKKHLEETKPSQSSPPSSRGEGKETFVTEQRKLHESKGEANDEWLTPAGNFQGNEAGEGGVLQAIGETIVEIGQTTKGLLVGQGQGQGQHRVTEEGKKPHSN